MKSLKAHAIAVGVVSSWGAFAWLYLGSEDGSSGLSVLGWLQAGFLAPGAILCQVLKGMHGNSDLPLIAAASWVTYGLVGAAVVGGAQAVGRRLSRGSSGQRPGHLPR